VKRILLTLAVFWLGADAFAQGTLIFANLAPGVNAPVTNELTGARLVTVNFLADLYFSNTTNAPTDSLTAAGFNVAFSTITSGGGGGYFLGGTRTVSGAAGPIEAQVRIWDSQFGSTYEAARAAGGFSRFSSPIVMALAIPPAPPPALVGLTFVPEPSSFALAALAVVLVLHRKSRLAGPRN